MQMTNIKLFELAAKAYGLYEEYPEPDYTVEATPYGVFVSGKNTYFEWNPRDNNSHAFDLAFSKLHMKVYPGEAYCWDEEVADYSTRFCGVCDEDENPDVIVATRLAIFRAAVAVGKEMK